MKKFILSPVVLLLLVPFIFLLSCNTDSFDLDNLSTQTSLNQQFSAPLIKGTLNMGDLMETLDSTNLLNEDSTGLFYFAYKDSLLSQTANDQIEIPDQDFIKLFIQSEYNIPAVFVQEYTIEETKSFPFNFLNNGRLDSIKTDAFTFTNDIHYTYRNSCQVVVTYLNLVKDGVPFTDTININNTSGNFDTTITTVLRDYNTILENPDTSDKSYFPIYYKFTMFDDGNAIEDDDVLDISSQINNIDLRSAFGYIGQDTLMIEESSISLDFFANSFSGDIEFASPEFNFFIKNSYGVPVEVDLSGIKGYQENSPDTTYLNFTGGVNPFAINYPTLDNMNEFEKTTISINSDNSNLSELLAAKPEVVTFKSFAHSNPDGPSDSYNFVTDQSRFDVNYEVVLPLWFRTDGFELKDTMDMDLEDAFGDVNMLKELITTLEVNNGLPVDLDIQLYFLDENYVMIDSLFTGTNQYLITGANVDANGEVVSANNSAPKVTLDEDRVDKLENVKKAIFSAGFRTSDFNQDTKVKFYSDYSLSFKMYMDVTTDID